MKMGVQLPLAALTILSICGAAACSLLEPGSPQFVYGRAIVESIAIQILESFPVQVEVVAEGSLPDDCTRIHQVTQSRAGNAFTVRMTTVRPVGVFCAQVLVPFEERIALDVLGLKAGIYTVRVNKMTGSFTLDADNNLPAAVGW